MGRLTTACSGRRFAPPLMLGVRPIRSEGWCYSTIAPMTARNLISARERNGGENPLKRSFASAAVDFSSAFRIAMFSWSMVVTPSHACRSTSRAARDALIAVRSYRATIHEPEIHLGASCAIQPGAGCSAMPAKFGARSNLRLQRSAVAGCSIVGIQVKRRARTAAAEPPGRWTVTGL